MIHISESDIAEIASSIINSRTENTAEDVVSETLSNLNETQTESQTESQVEEVEKVNLKEFTDTNDFASRFSGAEWFDKMKEVNVIVAGCGGIGSWASLLLSRLNISRLTLIDPDIIEEVNMAGQFYPVEDVGMYKVESIMKALYKYSPNTSLSIRNSTISEGFIKSINVPYGSDIKIFVCGFDNMEARKTMFKIFTDVVNDTEDNDIPPCNHLFIDGRLTADVFQIYCIRGDDAGSIEKYLNSGLAFSDAEADRLPCSFKQTSYLAAMIGAFITNYVVNYVGSFSDGAKSIFYNVPFFTEYNAVLGTLKSLN